MKNRVFLSIVSLVLALVLAISITACIFENPKNTSDKDQNNFLPPEGEREPIDYTSSFLLVDAIFRSYSIFDVDYETAMLSAIRAYVEATGDKNANFYTSEEFEAMIAEDNGDLYGIGVQVIFDYDEYFMEVVLTMPDSPAEKHLQIGDKVTHVFVDNQKIALADIVAENKVKLAKIYPYYTDEEINTLACYETFQYAVSILKGPEGTYTKFTVERNGSYTDYEIMRAKVKTISVTCKQSIRDSKVGIVSISQFDLTTPVQFKECMNALIDKGCNKFVFDLRNNLGGLVVSAVSVISTILDKGDLIVSTKDATGAITETKVNTIKYPDNDDYVTCNITESEIGMYGKYEMVVLVNQDSASSSEIFTAALRDHNKADIVGMKTYGKGSMQTTVPLEIYGEEYFGAIKLTTKLHYPPSGESYDGGIGIAPDYEVELEGVAAETHFYKLTEEIDNQLQKAVSLLID
jgi:carboxyl-terminal processing protease